MAICDAHATDFARLARPVVRFPERSGLDASGQKHPQRELDFAVNTGRQYPFVPPKWADVFVGSPLARFGPRGLGWGAASREARPRASLAPERGIVASRGIATAALARLAAPGRTERGPQLYGCPPHAWPGLIC
jgi:hypothetical protein